MSFSKIPANNAVKNRRTPNAYMLFVKEQKNDLLPKCPDENKAVLGSFFGKKWRSMAVEEKQVFYDKYNALKKLEKPNSVAEENLMYSENNGLLKDISSNKTGAMDDQESSKVVNKQTLDESFILDGAIKKYTSDVTSAQDDFSFRSEAKQKPLKKVRRSPNAFLVFAQEQRHHLDPSIKIDKKCHQNTILGQMWRELSDSEKEKYYEEANRLSDLHKKSETTPTIKRSKTKNKVYLKNIARKKSVGRPCKKKKEFLPTAIADSQNNEASGIEKSETESNTNKILEKVESTANMNSLSESHAANDNSISSHLHQNNSVMSHFHHRISSSIDPHHSNHCSCPSASFAHSNFCSCQSASVADSNTNDILRHYPCNTSASKSCFGAGIFPPAFPSYPFNPSLWMYQQATAHHLFPLPPPNFPPFPYSYSLPYFYNNPYNNIYFSSYSSLYSGRYPEPSSYASSFPTNASASAASSGKKEASEAVKNAENSDEELMVVDGDPEIQNRENDSA